MRIISQIIPVLMLYLALTGIVAPSPVWAEDREAVHLLMALDVSGSMRTTDPLRLLPKAANIMLSLLSDEDHLGLLSFEDVTRVVLPLGPLEPARRRQGTKALQGLDPRGLYTDIYTALAQALTIFNHDPFPCRALLLISDGRMDIDPKKGESAAYVQRLRQEVLPAYVQAKIPIFTVAFSPQADQELLKNLAEATGGRFLPVLHARAVHLAFTWLYENLKRPQLAPLVGDRFLIDASVSEAVLIASRAKEWQAITLTAPAGEKFTLRSHPPNVKWYAAPTFDMVTISQPTPGFWSINGFAPGEGKVVLMTDLRLVSPLLPEEFGSDEAPLLGAALMEKDQPVVTPALLDNLSFSAQLHLEGQEPVARELREVPPEQEGLWPPGTRIAGFPPFHGTGQAVVKVQVLGKTLQREQLFYVPVAAPWYNVGLRPGNPKDSPRLVCQATPGRSPRNLQGWLSIQSSPGEVATFFLVPPSTAEFSWPLPTSKGGSQLVDLRLWGTTLTGRPLVLQPGPWRLDLSATKETLSPPAVVKWEGLKFSWPRISGWSLSGAAFQDRRLWLAGGGLVLAALTGLGLWWLRRVRGQAAAVLNGGAGSVAADDLGSAEKLNLLLKAQVESLEKEKLELKTTLEDLRGQLDTLRAEKAHLVAELERLSQSTQQQLKVINELEKRLEAAETEAKSVQMEYMNLFARNAEEKKTLSKE